MRDEDGDTEGERKREETGSGMNEGKWIKVEKGKGKERLECTLTEKAIKEGGGEKERMSRKTRVVRERQGIEGADQKR